MNAHKYVSVSLVIIQIKVKENSSESSIATILKILKSRFRLHVVCCPNLYNLLWRLVYKLNCINVTNLSLLDVFHLDCLNKFAASLPPSTAPAGYTCPNCKVSVCFHSCSRFCCVKMVCFCFALPHCMLLYLCFFVGCCCLFVCLFVHVYVCVYTVHVCVCVCV